MTARFADPLPILNYGEVAAAITSRQLCRQWCHHWRPRNEPQSWALPAIEPCAIIAPRGRWGLAPLWAPLWAPLRAPLWKHLGAHFRT